MITIEKVPEFPSKFITFNLINTPPYYNLNCDLNLDKYIIGGLTKPDETGKIYYITSEFGFKLKDFIMDYDITNYTSTLILNLPIYFNDTKYRYQKITDKIFTLNNKHYIYFSHSYRTENTAPASGPSTNRITVYYFYYTIQWRYYYNKNNTNPLIYELTLPYPYIRKESYDNVLAISCNFKITPCFENEQNLLKIGYRFNNTGDYKYFDISVKDLYDHIGDIKMINNLNNNFRINLNYSTDSPLAIYPDNDNFKWICTGKKYDIRCQEMLDEKYWTKYVL